MMQLKKYKPHEGQLAFHHSIQNLHRFVLMLCGIRGGKTYCGAREALKQAWNSKRDIDIPYGIIAPTYHMLDRTTWREFKSASKPLIESENDTKKIIRLKNGREVFGFSADNFDKIRNVTLMGFWGDECREWKDFAGCWDVLLGRVLSTEGKGIVTSSPNSFDDMYDIFLAQKDKDYGVVRFSTYENTTIPQSSIDSLLARYDKKFGEQELLGKIVAFSGSVYYCFDRTKNAGDYAFKVANYNPFKDINLDCDFNVNPMAWVLTQYGVNPQTGLKEVYVIDEIYLPNSNTMEACREFKNRYPNHRAGVVLYGDATGKARSSNSNVTNWQIIENELLMYAPINKVPMSNPAEKDRVNAMNSMICNGLDQRRLFVNPKCTKVIGDLEQVSYKKGSVQIDKSNLKLTHISDALGYEIESEFGLDDTRIHGLKI